MYILKYILKYTHFYILKYVYDVCTSFSIH